MIKEIDFTQLKRLVEDDKAILVDVRENEEVKEDGSIQGDENWPLSTFAARQKDISHTRPTIFYCRSGLRSIKAAEIATEWTNQEIYSLSGGFLHYSKEKSK